MNENPCYYWNRPNLTMPQPTGKGLPTTLMVQSEHYPATSYSLAVSAHTRYAGSRLVTVTREGDHGIYGGVNKCADTIVNTFLTTGKAPAKDVTCVGEGNPALSAPTPGTEDESRRRTAGLRRQHAIAPHRGIHQSRFGISALRLRNSAKVFIWRTFSGHGRGRSEPTLDRCPLGQEIGANSGVFAYAREVFDHRRRMPRRAFVVRTNLSGRCQGSVPV